jgi:outer membrane protein with glycine zipper
MQRPVQVTIGIAMLGLMGLAPMGAEAQKPVVYPAKGQSPQQQQKDQTECEAWAKQTTGIDPVAVAQAPTPAPGSTVGGGQRLGGAARGAAGGAIIGAIAGDAGTGAGVGAVVGTMAGGRRARQQQAQQQQQAEAQKQQTLNTSYRAVAACLEGRGYSIK